MARERAAERGSSRELPPEEQPGPAVSLETRWPMRAAEAVYRGGASPWQQEKPSERLLNAGPRAVGAHRSAVGRGGGDEGPQQSPRAGHGEPREEEGTSSRTFLGPGRSVSQVRDWEGCGPRRGRAGVRTRGRRAGRSSIPSAAHQGGGTRDRDPRGVGEAAACLSVTRPGPSLPACLPPSEAQVPSPP